jgi:arsenate reductase-like glutaredoxin family protein
MDSMRIKAQKMMPSIMALNKNPTMGMKNNRQPMPGVSNLTAYAKGGKVMAKGGAADMKQDKAMLARHNRLMHPGQKSKLKSGGMVKKYADGGSVDPSNKPEMRERLKQAEIDSKKIMRDAQDGYKKGGKVKSKSDKKKVMGTVGEAKALMNAMKKVRRPATLMPGARMAGLGMAPPMAPQMAPPMKKGGKVRKYADGGKAEAKGFLDKPRDFITDDRYPGKKLSIRDVGKGVKEGFTNYKDMINRTGKFESPSKDGKVMKRAAGGSTKRHTNSKGV